MKKHIKSEDLKRVKELDLLSYLQNYEPDELIRISRNVYGTKAHSSLQISNGLWHWFAQGIGGKSALDYLIKVNETEFIDAAIYLQELIDNKPPTKIAVKQKPKYQFQLPKPSQSNDQVIEYLCKERMIDTEVVMFCISHYDLYESSKHHDVVFVGYENGSTPRYATIRSTTSNKKREVAGSDKRFGFTVKSKEQSEVLNVFEGAIDLLSYCTILKQQGRDWRGQHMLSLGGVAKAGKEIRDSSIPLALEEYLKKIDIKKINLFLNNDEAGKQATYVIFYHLSDNYNIKDCSLKKRNDINELLCQKRNRKNYEKNR
jgi:hypothetical protein